MEFGINVEYLENIIKPQKQNKSLCEREKYKTKIVEYTFFVENEVKVSEKLNNTYHDSLYRFLTVKKCNFVKICETNKKLLEKMNLSLDLYNNFAKKIVLLKYKRCIDFSTNVDEMLPFINRFFYNHHDSHAIVFWDLINDYEVLLNDLLFLSKNNIVFVDFSSKNLLYDGNTTIFLHKFEKCLIQKKYKVSENDLNHLDQHGNFQKLSKYVEIEEYINKFINIINSIEYYGNKHFDLYFSKHLIKSKNFYLVYQNLDTIIDDYLDNLYFLKHFSDKFKNERKIKWKKIITSRIEENVQFLKFIDITKLNWKLYLFMVLENYQPTVWEIFSLNSLFLNITYYMIKIFDIQEKNSLLQRYFKFLFKNIDINCCSFANDINAVNALDLVTCRENYNDYRNTFEYGKDYHVLDKFVCLSNVTPKQQEELYDFVQFI
jgi:hypothetical protein